MKFLKRIIEAILDIELPKITREKTETEIASENIKNNLQNDDN